MISLKEGGQLNALALKSDNEKLKLSKETFEFLCLHNVSKNE
jgi:hypothetical protein